MTSSVENLNLDNAVDRSGGAKETDSSVVARRAEEEEASRGFSEMEGDDRSNTKVSHKSFSKLYFNLNLSPFGHVRPALLRSVTWAEARNPSYRTAS